MSWIIWDLYPFVSIGVFFFVSSTVSLNFCVDHQYIMSFSEGSGGNPEIESDSIAEAAPSWMVLQVKMQTGCTCKYCNLIGFVVSKNQASSKLFKDVFGENKENPMGWGPPFPQKEKSDARSLQTPKRRQVQRFRPVISDDFQMIFR